jgi:hypothetical protein
MQEPWMNRRATAFTQKKKKNRTYGPLLSEIHAFVRVGGPMVRRLVRG